MNVCQRILSHQTQETMTIRPSNFQLYHAYTDRSIEEARRSGRATKGQHTKRVEDVKPELSKPKAKGKGSKGKTKKDDANPEAQSEGEQDSVRCICGATEEDDDVAIHWVACDKCGVWQHTDCMLLSNADFEGKPYFCEQCRPQDHKDLLAKIKRGERPWEAATLRREEQKQKKKGKKGRKSRASEVKPQDEVDEVAPTHDSAQTEEPMHGSSQKRKHDDGSPAIVEVAEVRIRTPIRVWNNLLIFQAGSTEQSTQSL